MEDGSEVGLYGAGVPDTAKVGPQPETIAGCVKVWDLKELKDVVIPDGVEKIGNHWFWGSDVERVTIPASAREIGAETFCYCMKLTKITFAENS